MTTAIWIGITSFLGLALIIVAAIGWSREARRKYEEHMDKTMPPARTGIVYGQGEFGQQMPKDHDPNVHHIESGFSSPDKGDTD
jgi:hypothetical protein